MWSHVNSHTVIVEYKMFEPFWKTVWHYLVELHICIHSDPEILVLGTYPSEMYTH